MTSAQVMERRTWLDGKVHELLSKPFVLHYDVLAYTDIAGAVWLAIEARQGGVSLMAVSLYRADPVTLALEPRTMAPALTPIQWGRDTHTLFKALHPAALKLCPILPGYSRKSVLCHYVTRDDAPAMPRGAINRYTYTRVASHKTEPLPDLL